MPDRNEDPSQQPGVPCAGAVVWDRAGRLLLIQRGQPPEAGSWSLPGGRIEAGESPAEAAVREVAEETGLTVAVQRLLGRVRVGHYDVWDYLAVLCPDAAAPGTRADPEVPGRPVGSGAQPPRPGSDAVDARWVSPAEVPTLRLSTGLTEALVSWGLLPARPTTA